MGCAGSKDDSPDSKRPGSAGNNKTSFSPIATSNNSLAGLKMPSGATNGASAGNPPTPAKPLTSARYRLTKTELEERIVSSGTVQQKEQAGISLQYAWVSQRGFYPNALDKPNQDSYSVLPNFGDNMAYFAVYDGHGAEGHTCAWFVRDHVRAFMLLFLRLCRNLIVVFVFSCQMR
jgi:hypothetical protein